MLALEVWIWTGWRRHDRIREDRKDRRERTEYEVYI